MSLLKPKLFSTLKNYSREQFIRDLIAGIVVGIVALPLAIAFAIASGVSPEKGLYTAIIAGFIISALGGSRVQIGGPTGAFIVIVFGIVQKYGVDGLTIATFMAGIILMMMGFARFGLLIKFVPHPLIVGFTSAIALIIFSSQIKDFFGLTIDKVPSEFIDKWSDYAGHISSLNSYSLIIALATVIITQGFSKITSRIPGSLIAILLLTAVVYFLKWPVETIGSRFGAIPSSLPTPVVPHITLDVVRHLIQPAFTIALLGSIESLLSAVVSDGMIGARHRSNMELIAQGAANIFSSIFGGIPATGAIARTATNVKNGGRTPVAGIVHALVLLLIMIFIGRWAVLIPMSCLAGILMVVAYNMSEWRSFLSIAKGPRPDAAILLTTFFLTVLVDLTVAIEVGMVMSAFLFMKRMSEVSHVDSVTDSLNEEEEKDDPKAISKYKVPPGVEVYEIEGPLFFGAASKFMESMNIIEKKPRLLILRMRHVPFIDATGIHTVSTVWKKSSERNIKVILSGVNQEVYDTLDKSGLLDKIDKANVLPDIDAALKRAGEVLA